MTDSPLRVGLVGAGSMGRAVAYQIKLTTGMDLKWVTDLAPEAAASFAEASELGCVTLLQERPVDVMVEATNSVGDAASHCLAAFANHAHVVLMNAEVDLALGPLLHHEATRHGLVITSDAGDQHGVLATLIQEAQLMGFDIVQAGNIKGFLDRRATPESIREEAQARSLSPVQCCAYTDGTKLHIEMAVLANALGYLPPPGGMTGPRAKTVQEALTLFDFSQYADIPRIDYLLGAEPQGGVYLIVKSREEFPAEHAAYLSYYKMGNGPYYLLYRPYHLCHLETPKAILGVAAGRAILSTSQRTCDVYAHAKADLAAGTLIQHAIGSAELYGIVAPVNAHQVPIALLETGTTLKRSVSRDQPLTFEDLDLPDNHLTDLWHRQQALLGHS